MTSEQPSVERVIEKLPSRFRADQAKDVTCVYQFILDEHDVFYIDIRNQECRVIRERHSDPDITLILNSVTFIRVVTGEQDGMGAFLKGHLRAEGNVMLATRLTKLFRK